MPIIFLVHKNHCKRRFCLLSVQRKCDLNVFGADNDVVKSVKYFYLMHTVFVMLRAGANE